MPNGSGAFANEVINLYTESIGSWSYIIIAAAAFSIMFGTSIAVFDGYARSVKRCIELLFYKEEEQEKWQNKRRYFIISLLVISLGSFMIIYYFHDQPKGFKSLVDLATTISFLIAPIIAIVNFKLVMSKRLMKTGHPPLWLQVLSYAGILFLSGFTLFFIYIKIMS
jgi:Mn2+/Fe2+ NRAMP family transporter